MDKNLSVKIVEDRSHIENQDVPVINIVVNPDGNDVNVPLFIKKLWNIVNDENNENIISWNENGDGFIIHDQLQFVSQTLPRYFKHNQLTSFVRQLNLYDFHKIQSVRKDEFQFSHPFFMKNFVELLPLIKRKTHTGRQKTTGNSRESAENAQHSSEVGELLTAIKNIKSKSDTITNEMSKLRQENAALWGEMNSLRVKYSKQTKIINKLIHFLIAYMQKHHNSRKSGRTVSTSNSNKYLKTGPKIMELDYRYKNNPHDFWSDFDNHRETSDITEQEAYTVVEPGETNAETNNQEQDAAESPSMRVFSTIEEIPPSSISLNQDTGSPANQSIPQFDYTKSHPSSSKASNSALQRSGEIKENLSYLIDNSRVEMNAIKELLKNLTPEDMTHFYKLVNENYKNQEDELSVDSEKELISLTQMFPLGSSQEYEADLSQENLEPLNNIIDKHIAAGAETSVSPSVFDDIIQEHCSAMPAAQTSPNIVQEPTVMCQKVDNTSLDLISDDLLNTDELLNNVSVEQYFNID